MICRHVCDAVIARGGGINAAASCTLLWLSASGRWRQLLRVAVTGGGFTPNGWCDSDVSC